MRRHRFHQSRIQVGFAPMKRFITAYQAFYRLAANFNGLWFCLQDAHDVKAHTGG